MTVPLLTASGLFTRLGGMIGGINETNSARGATLQARLNTIAAGYNTAQQDQRDALYGSGESQRSVSAAWISYLQSLAQSVTVKMAYDDAKIAPVDLQTALVKIIQQMTTNSESLNRATVTASVSAFGSNVGSGACIASLVRGDGLTQRMVFAEALRGACTTDSYSGGATEGLETFTFLGEPATVSEFDYLWPLGSGTSTTVTATDDSDGLLTNGNWETWTVTNEPDDWIISVGTPGTTISRGSSPYTGTFDLQFTGDGAQLTKIYQTVDLTTETVYAVSCWVKVSSVPAAGVLRLSLHNGTAVINDSQGNANSITLALTAATTSYVNLSGFFRLPSVLPSTVRFQLELTTALTNTVSMHLDRLAMVAATQLYAGGPFVAIFSGATAFAGQTVQTTGDYFTLTVANNLTTTSFVRSLDRIFGLRTLGLQFPDSATATISDGLIT